MELYIAGIALQEEGALFSSIEFSDAMEHETIAISVML